MCDELLSEEGDDMQEISDALDALVDGKENFFEEEESPELLANFLEIQQKLSKEVNAEQAVDTLKLEDNDVLYEMLYGNGILQLEIVFAVNAALLDPQEEGNVFEDAEIDAKALVKDPNEEALNSTLMSGLRSQRLYQSIGIPRVV